MDIHFSLAEVCHMTNHYLALYIDRKMLHDITYLKMTYIDHLDTEILKKIPIKGYTGC